MLGALDEIGRRESKRILDRMYRIDKIDRLNTNGKALSGKTRVLVFPDRISHQSQ